MACALTQGLAVGCRDGIGGIKTVYIVENASVGAITSSSGIISAITMVGGAKFWTYNLVKEVGEFTDDMPMSVPNGTVYSDQKLMFTARKMSATLRGEIKLLSQNLLKIMVLDNNGTYWLLGEINGMDMTKATGKTGKMLGDFGGYDFEFQGKEPNMAQTVTSSIIAAIIQ